MVWLDTVDSDISDNVTCSDVKTRCDVTWYDLTRMTVTSATTAMTQKNSWRDMIWLDTDDSDISDNCNDRERLVVTWHDMTWHGRQWHQRQLQWQRKTRCDVTWYDLTQMTVTSATMWPAMTQKDSLWRDMIWLDTDDSDISDNVTCNDTERLVVTWHGMTWHRRQWHQWQCDMQWRKDSLWRDILTTSWKTSSRRRTWSGTSCSIMIRSVCIASSGRPSAANVSACQTQTVTHQTNYSKPSTHTHTHPDLH